MVIGKDHLFLYLSLPSRFRISTLHQAPIPDFNINVSMIALLFGIHVGVSQSHGLCSGGVSFTDFRTDSTFLILCAIFPLLFIYF